jgi:hypothetical protein
MSAQTEPTTDQVDYTEQELLSDVSCVEPLIANGVRCHGGFDEDGQYRSPRTRFRTPAITAWQRQLEHQGHDLLQISPDLIPPTHPSVAQAKLLLTNGAREPIVRALTIISIVEGFGAMIRDVKVPNLRERVADPIDGTALDHLTQGLFEAHARDESGYRDEGGHKQMWEAARDAALENPKIPGDVLMRLMGRRGRRGGAQPLFPEIGEPLERMLGLMANVLVVEVIAEETFEWGISLLSDPSVSAAPDAAGAMIAHIRADEKPHVEYLRTALSEVRARDLKTIDGKILPGRAVIDGLLHRTLREITRNRPREQREDIREGLEAQVAHTPNARALLEEFDALESSWTPPETTGFEPRDAA